VDGDTLIVGIPLDPGSANPLVLPYQLSKAVSDLVEPGLVRSLPSDDGLQFELAVAKSVVWSDAGDVLTYHLRDDVRWEDGVALTSADVAFGWSLVADPVVASNWHGDARFVAGVDTPDPLTAVFRFVGPRNRILQQIPTTRGIVPQHVLASVDRGSLRGHPSTRAPLASGPWRVARWVPDDQVVLEPNPTAPPDWKPHLDRIVLRVLPE
jgi:peptide/nickel transport system substrate-binding protein